MTRKPGRRVNWQIEATKPCMATATWADGSWQKMIEIAKASLVGKARQSPARTAKQTRGPAKPGR